MIFKTDTFILDNEYYSKIGIFIEISGSEEQYQIFQEDKGLFYLLRLRMGDRTFRIITEPIALYNDRELLGKVSVYFNGKAFKEFPIYDVFWKTIKREYT